MQGVTYICVSNVSRWCGILQLTSLNPWGLQSIPLNTEIISSLPHSPNIEVGSMDQNLGSQSCKEWQVSNRPRPFHKCAMLTYYYPAHYYRCKGCTPSFNMKCQYENFSISYFIMINLTSTYKKHWHWLFGNRNIINQQ